MSGDEAVRASCLSYSNDTHQPPAPPRFGGSVVATVSNKCVRMLYRLRHRMHIGLGAAVSPKSFHDPLFAVLCADYFGHLLMQQLTYRAGCRHGFRTSFLCDDKYRTTRQCLCCYIVNPIQGQWHAHVTAQFLTFAVHPNFSLRACTTLIQTAEA